MRCLTLPGALCVLISFASANKIHDIPWPARTAVALLEPSPTPGAVATNLKRQKQVPFQVCPEMLGKAVKQCSACGGDSKRKGYCNDLLLSGQQGGCIGTPNGACGFYCECTNSGGQTTIPPSPKQTQIVTSVVNGQTVTGVFSVTTLSQWKDLRSHTTVTTSVNSKETEAAIAIFAGGVAWWLISQSGAAAVVLTPPPQAPEGSEEDDKKCSPEPKCSDNNCGGKSPLGLCKAGDKMNCPCEDKKECPTEPPKCSATNCGGNDGHNKCKAEALEGCQCCPNEQPQCSATECKGKDGKCEGETLKGCACGNRNKGPAPLLHPNIGAPSQGTIDNTAWEIFQSVFGGSETELFGSRGNPSSKPTCSDNTAKSALLPKYNTGSEDLDPNTIQYRMRQVLCSDKCETPAGIPSNAAVAVPYADGCEIAVALASNTEAYARRDTHSRGAQWQDCWDSLANITETCIKQGPNSGWVNGPDAYEFFQAGFRPINGDGNKHPKNLLDPKNALGAACDNNNKPACGSCNGGSNNLCTEGDKKGCACQPAPQTPTPTGGWWMGEFRPGIQPRVNSVFVIGDKDHKCERIGWPNIVTYQALSYKADGSLFSPQSAAAAGTETFTLDHVCADGIKLTFTPDSSNSNVLKVVDNQKSQSTGFCAKVTDNAPPASCNVGEGSIKYTVEAPQKWHCQMDGNPSYCNI